MTLEELKAEAEKLGYKVVRKPIPTGRKLPCTCGSYRFWNNYTFDTVKHIREYYVQCRSCKREGPHIEKDINMPKDEALAKATAAWNQMIEKMRKGESVDD